jgi:endonuclease V-like protein UPF0215 family
MPASFRPHLIGVDDSPFEKRQPDPVPVVGVTMEGWDQVESVAITSFPVDGDGATAFLDQWISGLRGRPILQGVMLGGITIGGLGVIDLPALAEALGIPVLAVTRRDPAGSDLRDALSTAGLADRIAMVERSPKAYRVADGLFLAHAGCHRTEAERMVLATVGKARLPEPLRVAHLVARALVMGESRGRV